MYAIIRAGGKQAKVRSGDVIEVERIKDPADSIEFKPILVVDDDGTTHALPAALNDAVVKAKVLGEVKGDKIDIFKYKNKTGYRRHQGHRQTFTQVEITDIALAPPAKKKATTKKAASTKKAAAPEPAADTDAASEEE
jgi:large subunit ribosomal protein L21